MTFARPRVGFTLVELLVVMGIIVVLMGLLLVAVQAARETARQGACGAQLRELSMGVAQHAIKKERFPGWKATVGGQTVTWVPQIFPYVDQQQKWDTLTGGGAGYKEALKFLWCPSDPPTGLNSDPLQAPYPLSYACNAGKADAGGGEPGTKSDAIFHDRSGASPYTMGIDEVRRTGGMSSRVVLHEGTGLSDWGTSGAETAHGSIVPLDLTKTHSFHKFGMNMGYADGHVEFFLMDAETAAEETALKALYLRKMTGN